MPKEEPSLTIPLLLCVATAIVAVIFIRTSYVGKTSAKLKLKAAASALFLLTGALCTIATPLQGLYPSYATFILLGLVFGFAGDVLLELQEAYPEKQHIFFIAGLSSFLIGHIFYVIALSRFTPTTFLQPLVVVVLFIATLALEKLFRIQLNRMKIPVYLYAAVISAMVGYAVGAAIYTTSALTVVTLIAAILFFISDAVLAYIYFGPKKVFVLRAINLGCYYLAQILLAFSIFLR